MCVWCPLWPVQRLLSEQPELSRHGRSVGVAAPHQPPASSHGTVSSVPMSERPLILFAEGRRGLQVTACSPEAIRRGIHVGMPLGEAKSLLPETTRHKRQPVAKPIWQRADPGADRLRLQALAIHCQRYSPLVGLEEASEPEALWLDISGSEALFGGERRLVETLRTDLAQQGIQVRVAIADTWGTAWGVSHFAEPVVSLIPSGDQIHALIPLPVAALRIPDNVIDSLRTLDVTTIGRLMKLPNASLPSRFGKELGRRLDQALGLAPELLTAERLVEPIRAEWLFEEPVADRQALEQVCDTLLERVFAELDKSRAGLRELICHWLGTTTEPIRLRLWRPSTDRRHLLELLRLQCERCHFTAGVTGVRLEVIEMGLPPVRQTTLFEEDDSDRRERLLAELAERLGSRLGTDAVLRPNLCPDPLPEFSCEHRPWLERRTVSTSETAISPSRLRCRPLRLLRVPQPLEVGQFSTAGWPNQVDRSQVVRISGPERIESGWWRGPDAKRDYFRIDLANGASLWAFCDRSSDRWFLHGLFS